MKKQIVDVDYGTFMTMNDPTFTQRLYDSGATFTKEVQKTTSPFLSFFLTFILPFLIFIGIGQYMSKKLTEQAGGKNSTFSISLSSGSSTRF